MKKWFGCLAVCMALCVPVLSQAEDAQKDTEIVSTMEEVVVTAGRVEEKKKEITANVTIINENILSITPAVLLQEQRAKFPNTINNPVKYKVVANLPYYITSPILRHFLEAPIKPQLMVLMVQKEK